MLLRVYCRRIHGNGCFSFLHLHRETHPTDEEITNIILYLALCTIYSGYFYRMFISLFSIFILDISFISLFILHL